MNENIGHDNLSLILKYKGGQIDAKNQLVENNSALVMSIVRRFLNRGHEKDDLFQIGCIGLIKAIDHFNETLGVQFSTYAVPMIMGEIRRFIRDDGPIKISRSIKENMTKVRRAYADLSIKLNREPSVNEIGDWLKMDPEDVIVCIEAMAPIESLYATTSNDEDNGQFLIDKVKQNNLDNEIEILERIALKEELTNLEQRDKMLISLRFFKGKTQTETARILGVSQVQISRIEKKILDKLKKRIETMNISKIRQNNKL